MLKPHWEAVAGENGYFCVNDDGQPVLQGAVSRDRREVWVSADQPLEVTKMFGPLIFMPIRVTANFEACEWIIERSGEGDEWVEVARVPGQLDSDFEEGTG